MALATMGSPSQPSELLALARQLYDKGELREAETACRRAISIAGADSELHRMLGETLQAQSRVDEAVASFEEAVRLEPTDVDAVHGLAVALGEQGQMSKALAADREALRLCPSHIGVLYHLAQLKVFSPGDPDLRTLEALADDSDGLEDRALMFLSFALAKAYEDVGDYNRSFRYLHQGNAIKRKDADYDVAADIAVIEETAEVFSDEFLSQFDAVGSSSELPILIVGMPRSGTTLVEQILASHPAVHGGGEQSHLRELATAVSLLTPECIRFPAGARHLQSGDFTRFGEGYVARLQALAPRAERVTDKLPFNFLYLGLVRLMMPRARIVHCVRDPVDTCLSCYKANFASVPTATDLGDLGRYYRAYERLMDHWREVFPPGWILHVEYEALVADVEHEAHRLISHSGLDWDDRCLEFHSTQRVVRTWSFAQVRRPIYRNAVGRWRRYEAHLGPLLAALGLDTEESGTVGAHGPLGSIREP